LFFTDQFVFFSFLTLLVEGIALFALARYYFRWTQKKIPDRMLLFCAIFCSASTLPYVWFVFPDVIAYYPFYLLVAESFAVIAEAIIYYFVLKISARDAFVLSFACNMLSFGAGLLVAGY
jgi:hypothetical protein